MAKLKKNIKEERLNCRYLSKLYSTIEKEERKNNQELEKISSFVKECENEVKEKLKIIKETEKKEKILEGLYLEVFNFTESKKKVYRAMYGDQMISFGTNFGKNYHKLIEKRNEIIRNRGIIKVNGTKIKQEVPEINIVSA